MSNTSITNSEQLTIDSEIYLTKYWNINIDLICWIQKVTEKAKRENLLNMLIFKTNQFFEFLQFSETQGFLLGGEVNVSLRPLS